MIDKLQKQPPKPSAKMPGVDAIANTTIKSTDLVVLFCDEIDEKDVRHVRESFKARGITAGVMALPTDAEIAVLDRETQEALYVALGRLLGK